MIECAVEGCHRTYIQGHGFCGMHYMRWHRHGDPGPTGPLQTRQGAVKGIQEDFDFQAFNIRRQTAKRHGLTLDEYEALVSASVCDCCKKPFHDPSGRVKVGGHIDHCHTTNSIRGVLCRKCNAGIGFLGDDLEGVQMAVDYLKRQA